MVALTACGGASPGTSGDDNGGVAGRPTESATPSPSGDGGEEAGGDSKGRGGEKKKGAPTKTTEGATASVEVIDTAFEPKDVSVTAGTEVRWEQTGLQPHSVTSSEERFDSSPRCSPIRTDDCLGEGDGFSFVFDKSGTYSYYCRVHGLPDGTGMVGVIEVTK